MEESRSNMKLHPTESFPSNNVMIHRHHPHPPSLSSPNRSDDDNGGPCQNDSGANEVVRSTRAPTTRTGTSTIFFPDHTIFFPDHVALMSGSGSGSVGSAAADAVRILQPFDSCLFTKFPGGGGVGMAAAAPAALEGFPFTAAQWKELQRQAMIYKYMTSSAPVPSDLLLPPIPTPIAPWSTGVGGSIHNLSRYGNRDVVVEPGRCKRTDGKKWRCSRDVAPHQKYCERHLHRGRPRSRKPVEPHSSSADINNKKSSRLCHKPTAHPINKTSTLPHSLLLGASAAQNISASEPNRVFGWAMDGEVVAANGVESDRSHFMESIYGTNAASATQQSFCGEEPLNLFSYTSQFASPGNISIHNRNDQSFLNSDLIPSKHPQIDQQCTSRNFIDSWSNGDLETMNESSLGSSLSPSSLTLSMAMMVGNAFDEGGMGLTTDSHHQKPDDCPVPWLLPFTSGGPLGEVLQPSSVVCGSNPALH